MDRHDIFPDDENGDVLRRMQEHGDDLSKPRNIDFTVVFPNERSAMAFAEHYRIHGFPTSAKRSAVVSGLPWDVVVVNHMVPTHDGIAEFERALNEQASRHGGRNDGWGSFQQ